MRKIKKLRVIVVGSGIAGLILALELLKRFGHEIDLTIVDQQLSKNGRLPRKNASNCGRIIEPSSEEKWKAAEQYAWKHYGAWAQVPDGGITPCSVIEYWPRGHNLSPPCWDPGVRVLSENELPKGKGDIVKGITYPAYTVYPRKHLLALAKRIIALGGKFQKRHVRSLEELGEFDVVCNCAGLGAVQFLNPKQREGIRFRSGQIVNGRTSKRRRARIIMLQAEGCFMVDHGNGELTFGAHNISGSTSTIPDPAATRQILQKYARRVGRLPRDLEVTDTQVGVRVIHDDGSLETIHEAGNGQLVLHFCRWAGSAYILTPHRAHRIANRLAARLKRLGRLK